MTSLSYYSPDSLTEAITLLGSADARPLAGGYSLLIEPQRSKLGGALVDLRRIGDLVGVTQGQGGEVTIGAMTPLAAIAAASAVQQSYAALAEAAASVGDAQVRNRATLGGNLAQSDAGNDLPAAILALGGLLHVQGAREERIVAASDFFTGPGQTALAAGELITAVTLPAPTGRSGSAYEKMKHPATLYAICGVAASVSLDANGAVEACSVAVTGAAEYPTRLKSVESALTGKTPTGDAIAAAAQGAGEGLSFRSDLFASADYRAHLTRVLTQRALTRALAQA